MNKKITFCIELSLNDFESSQHFSDSIEEILIEKSDKIFNPETDNAVLAYILVSNYNIYLHDVYWYPTSCGNSQFKHTFKVLEKYSKKNIIIKVLCITK